MACFSIFSSLCPFPSSPTDQSHCENLKHRFSPPPLLSKRKRFTVSRSRNCTSFGIRSSPSLENASSTVSLPSNSGNQSKFSGEVISVAVLVSTVVAAVVVVCALKRDQDVKERKVVSSEFTREPWIEDVVKFEFSRAMAMDSVDDSSLLRDRAELMLGVISSSSAGEGFDALKGNAALADSLLTVSSSSLFSVPLHLKEMNCVDDSIELNKKSNAADVDGRTVCSEIENKNVTFGGGYDHEIVDTYVSYDVRGTEVGLVTYGMRENTNVVDIHRGMLDWRTEEISIGVETERNYVDVDTNYEQHDVHDNVEDADSLDIFEAASVARENLSSELASERSACDAAFQAVLPTFAVAARTFGIITGGADGGLEVVGFIATVGFIAYDLLWAPKRALWWNDISQITDREKLVAFLKSRSILIDV